jgi:chromosome segregation ATPase
MTAPERSAARERAWEEWHDRLRSQSGVVDLGPKGCFIAGYEARESATRTSRSDTAEAAFLEWWKNLDHAAEINEAFRAGWMARESEVEDLADTIRCLESDLALAEKRIKELEADRADARSERDAYMRSGEKAWAERDALVAEVRKLRDALRNARSYVPRGPSVDEADLLADINALLKDE